MSSTVKDVMSTHVMAVRPAAGYKEMAAMLREQRVSAFPVIDDGNKVIGVVSESDLILGTFCCDPARFDVTVKDGVLTLRGTPETAVTGHDIVAAARHVEGVVAVRDRLRYPLVTTVHSDPPPD